MALCKSTSLVYTELLTLVYDIPSPTTAMTDYAIRLEKLTANGQFFLGTQMAGSLEQTAQTMSGVSFITACTAYASTNKTKIV